MSIKRGYFVKKILLAIINFYRKNISPMKAPCCRFYPTCSTYAIQAIEKYGKVLKREIPNLMKSVTVEDCNNLFKEIFLHNKISYTVYGDIKKEELISDEKFDKLFIK